MKLSIVSILTVFVIASSASAGLGDNSDRIEDLYGTIVQRRLRDDGTAEAIYAPVNGRPALTVRELHYDRRR